MSGERAAAVAHGFEEGAECGLVFLPGVKLERAGEREVLGLAGGV